MANTETHLLEVALARAQAQRELPGPRARRVARERAGLSQSDIARALGVTPACVSRWETGTREPRGRFVEGYLAVLDRLEQAARG